MGRTALIIGVIFLAIVFLLGLIFGVAWISATNKEVRLRNDIAAQAKANEASFDTMWKIIQGKAQVADEYKEAFKEIFPQIISGRYQGKNPLMQFVQEHNPHFSVSLYKGLSNSIEAERKRFLLGQQKLIDLKRQHDDLRQTWPSRWFVGDRPEIQITIVTSEKTEDTFRTGHEEPENLFPNRQKEKGK